MPTDTSTSNGRTTKRGRCPDRVRLLRHPRTRSAADRAHRRPKGRLLRADADVADRASPGKVADTLNEIIELNQEMAQELERVSQAVGKEGKITQRAHLTGAGGSWAASVNSVNTLIADLVQPTSEVARVIGAVAKGDLSQTMALDIEGRPLMGEFLRIGKTVNSMVDQLSSFASEVTRVAREVGTEGKLGGQAQVKGVARHLEGPDRQRELDGRQPDRPGAQHRRGDHRRGQRRPRRRRSRWT